MKQTACILGKKTNSCMDGKGEVYRDGAFQDRQIY